jgi:hypothetical protein
MSKILINYLKQNHAQLFIDVIYFQYQYLFFTSNLQSILKIKTNIIIPLLSINIQKMQNKLSFACQLSLLLKR